jgi:hypothetical protein
LPLGVSPDYIFALTNDTNFQVMGMHADGSVLCFHFKKNSKLVDKVAFRKTDTSDVFLLLFDSTGYPSVGSCKHQIYLFGNYHNQKADIVIMNTDGSVKEFKGTDAVFPQPFLDIIQKKAKSSGPSPGMFDLDSLTFSDAIGYAATGVGIVACVATLGGGGAWVLPCGAAIIDVASKLIPDEDKESKAMLEYAGAVFTMKGLVKNGALKALNMSDDVLDKWQLTLDGVSKASEVIEGWLKEPEQKRRIEDYIV